MRPTSAAGWRRGRAGRGLALALGLVAPGLDAAGAEPPKLIHHNSRAFRIPFNIEPEERARIKEVLLCVSEDQGRTWNPVVSRTTPEKRALAFRAPKDGEYWFAVQTMDVEGHLYPSATSAIEPKMKVIVDTVPPSVAIEPNGRRGSLASVRWEVRDDRALDRGSFVLEFQAKGASEWRQVPVPKPADAVGKATWDAGTAGPIRVRAQVADRARNTGEATALLPDGTPANPGVARESTAEAAEPPPLGTFASTSTSAEGLPQFPKESPARTPEPRPPEPSASATDSFDAPPPASDAAPTEPGARPQLVPSPRFNLQYEVADAGPGGPASVQLWVTQNGGRTWSPLKRDPDRKSPYPVVLGGEGVFGLKLVARSASNLGDSPPEPGEPPESLVEVDSTPPVVKLDRVQPGAGGDAGKLAIFWHASDLHLGPRSVTISVRPDAPGGEWNPIGPPVDNQGRYVWSVPPNAPSRFHLRVQVADAVGNVGSDETPEGSPVIVDRSRPKGRITRIEPIDPSSR